MSREWIILKTILRYLDTSNITDSGDKEGHHSPKTQLSKEPYLFIEKLQYMMQSCYNSVETPTVNYVQYPLKDVKFRCEHTK